MNKEIDKILDQNGTIDIAKFDKEYLSNKQYFIDEKGSFRNPFGIIDIDSKSKIFPANVDYMRMPISAELADHLVTCLSSKNRHTNKKQVKEISESLVKSFSSPNEVIDKIKPTTLNFDENGNIGDGSHRLSAISNAGKYLLETKQIKNLSEFIVHVNVDPCLPRKSITDVIDKGRPRSLSDQAEILSGRKFSRSEKQALNVFKRVCLKKSEGNQFNHLDKNSDVIVSFYEQTFGILPHQGSVYEGTLGQYINKFDIKLPLGVKNLTNKDVIGMIQNACANSGNITIASGDKTAFFYYMYEQYRTSGSMDQILEFIRNVCVDTNNLPINEVGDVLEFREEHSSAQKCFEYLRDRSKHNRTSITSDGMQSQNFGQMCAFINAYLKNVTCKNKPKLLVLGDTYRSKKFRIVGK